MRLLSLLFRIPDRTVRQLEFALVKAQYRTMVLSIILSLFSGIFNLVGFLFLAYAAWEGYDWWRLRVRMKEIARLEAEI